MHKFSTAVSTWLTSGTLYFILSNPFTHQLCGGSISKRKKIYVYHANNSVIAHSVCQHYAKIILRAALAKKHSNY